MRYEYHLSEERPLYTEFNLHPKPAPWVYDVHEGMEVGILLEGEEERVLHDHSRRLVPGEVWLSAIWEVHGFRILAPNTKALLFQFLPQYLGDEMLGEHPWFSLFAAPPPDRPYVATQPRRAQVLAVAEELRRETEERKRGWVSAVRFNLLRLLLLLSRDWHPQAPRGASGPAHSRHLLRIAPALTLVHTRLGQRTRVVEAAGCCSLSLSQFARVFRGTMGVSFGEFCLRARLASAAHWLLDCDDPLQAIATRTGFNDASHLHRTFLKRYGCTPGQYRQRQSGKTG